MDFDRGSAASLPTSVSQAIQQLIDQAQNSDLPIIDVETSAEMLAASVPEAAALGVERLRDEIAHVASKDSRVAVSFNRNA